jgi:hypothetical protein
MPQRVEFAGQFANLPFDLFSQIIGNISKSLTDRTQGELTQRSRTDRRHLFHLSEAQVKEIIAAYKSGSTTYELAMQYGIHRMRVSRILERSQVLRRRRVMNDLDAYQAIELYKSGLSLVRVGEQVGYTSNAIRKALIDNGIVTRDTHGRDRKS